MKIATEHIQISEKQAAAMRSWSRMDIEPGVTELLRSLGGFDLDFALAIQAIQRAYPNCRIDGARLEDPEGGDDMVLVAVGLEKPSLEVLRALQEVVRTSSKRGSELLRLVTFTV